MIAANQSIKFSVSGSADGWDDDDAQTAIRTELSKYFGVQRVYIDAPALGGVYYGWPWSGEVVVTTREAHAEIGDVSSIVAHAIYEATGYMPSVSAPAFGGPSNEDGWVDGGGIGDLLKGAGNSVSDAVAGIGDAIGNALGGAAKPLTDEFDKTINKLLIGVAIIAVVLIVSTAGKTTRVGVAL